VHVVPGQEVARGVVHGLLVESDLPLLNTVAGEPGRRADLTVQLGNGLPGSSAADGAMVAAMREGPHRFSLLLIRDGSFVLDVPGVLQAAIDPSGSRVTVHPAPGADLPMLGLVVSGLVLAVTLSIRGEALLHASAVERGGKALAIVGRSGAGKSTLAGMMCAAGGRLVSDDQLRISLAGGAHCWRSAVRLRARNGGLGAAVASRSSVGETSPDGRLLIEPTLSRQERTALTAILVPRLYDGDGPVQLEPLTGVPAAVALLAARALPGELAPMWEKGLFERTLGIAAAVPVWRASIPWRRESMDRIAAELLDRLPPDGS
jgi:hypothetical protein